MKKVSKKVLAAALVLTLAVPSAISMAADGDAQVKLPKPLAKITMQEDNLTENGYTNVAGTEAVKDDKMGTVLHVNASTEADGVFTDSEASFKNPLIGQDFQEFDILQKNEALEALNQEKIANNEDAILDETGHPIWYKGVVINYWIKVTGEENGVVLNFRNEDRLQYDKDDYVKYIVATKWAPKAVEDENADKEIDADFQMTNPEIYVDADGKEYTVFSKIGMWAPWRPDFPDNACTKSSSGTISAHPKDGGDDVTLAATEKQYEKWVELDLAKNPEINQLRCGITDGFMQTALDGGFVFIEDTNNEKAADASDGVNKQLNPNRNTKKDEAGNIIPDFRGYNFRNSLYWSGTLDDISDFMTDAYAADEETADWHMITVQIQNDSVEYYIDGVPFSGNDMTTYSVDNTAWPGTGNYAIGQSFNSGFGYKGTLYATAPSARTSGGWYGNMPGTLMLDWLSMENTTFSIGGTNLKAEPGKFTASSFSNPERVAEFYIDDIAFYGELLDDAQLEQLYQNGLKKMQMENPDDADDEEEEPTDPPKETEDPTTPEPAKGNGDIDGKDGATASDALEVLRFAAKLAEPTPEQRAAADTNLDGDINAEDALNILKLAAKIIPSLPVEK